MKVHSIKNSVKSLIFSYKVNENGNIVSNSVEVIPLESEMSPVDLMSFTLKNFTKKFLSEVNPLNISLQVLTLSLQINYKGTDTSYTIKKELDMSEVLSLTMWYSLDFTSDERMEHLKAFISSSFLNLYTEFETNFSTDYGIYFPENHKTPIANKCVSCQKSFDSGSIFENFVQQGKDGVEYYQKHPNEILLMTEDSYGEPYRFSSILYVKAYTENYTKKRRFYKCTDCDTEQTYIEKV